MGDLLFLTFDGHDRQYLTALNKATGETVWAKDRAIKYKTNDGDFKKAFSTPQVIEVAGKPQLVSSAAEATVAYDPRTGEEIWSVYHGGFNAAARPLYGHGLVYVNLEGGDRLVAVRPDGTGNVTKKHVAWKTIKQTPSRPSQLLIGDHFYMVSDKGVVSCLDAKTGETVWTHRIDGAHCASLICAPGPTAADLPRIYEDFFRSRAALDSGIPGTGLGMRIVREIVQDHGGSIEIDSTPGVGTTVTTRIPREAG